MSLPPITIYTLTRRSTASYQINNIEQERINILELTEENETDMGAGGDYKYEPMLDGRILHICHIN